jgi:hypothetical protein
LTDSAGDTFVAFPFNLRVALTPLIEVAKVAGPGRIGQLVGDSFNSSRLALLDTWARLADAQGGKRIVVAPASDGVFYVGDDWTIRRPSSAHYAH